MVIVEETDFLNLSPDNKFPRSELLSAWTPILNMLNKHHLLLDLMKLLVEVTTQDDDLKSKQAALWINDISRGFSKLERCLHIKLDLMKRNIGTELSVKQQFELIVKVADSTYTKLKHAIVLKGKLPHPSEFKEVLEEAMQNPSQHTLLFLDR
ncbi:uncharacterized protein LOC113469816 [Diaphorina citri]|uniref:Uncharacterized protein LOC113469816 n=1 Tax=Diaphorina citri TaxID=121845 RepID=A0A3Q0J4X9_DIACI|nr:uncharacterized protein LOC113469816 [Diaphorina citri]